jgi:hypothetical protein
VNDEYGLPSPSGARIAGDDYQHLFTWLQALKLRREVEGVTHVELEVGGNHNVDDVVVHRETGPPLYHQVKFVTAQREPLSHEWFTDPDGATKSPLQRFYDSFIKLSDDDRRPEMALETNRWPVDGDPILICVDGQTHKLVPRLPLATAGSASGRARRVWAEHLGVSEDELYEMLEHLEIRAGRSSFEELREHCCWLMGAVGLLDDVNAVDVGMSEMRRLVRQGIRRLDAASLAEIIAEKRLERGATRATLLVQQLDKDPLPELATTAVDWVELFQGNEPAARRQLQDPRGWNEVLRPQLREAVAALRLEGHRDVLVAGKMRLSIGLTVGVELSDVAGFAVAIRQRDDEWSSDGERTEVELERREVEVGQGEEVAVGISIAADVADDVVAYLQAEGLPISRFVNLSPVSGAGRSAISTPAEARGYAQALLDALRTEAAAGAPRLHLFQACPIGLSLLLGHIWNRLPETQLYEDLGAGAGYAPTFRLVG